VSLHLRRGTPDIGEVQDRNCGETVAKLPDQINARQALDLRIADQEVAGIQRGGQLNGGQGIVRMEYSVAFLPESLDYESDNGRIFVGNDDARPV